MACSCGMAIECPDALCLLMCLQNADLPETAPLLDVGGDMESELTDPCIDKGLFDHRCNWPGSDWTLISMTRLHSMARMGLQAIVTLMAKSSFT